VSVMSLLCVHVSVMSLLCVHVSVMSLLCVHVSVMSLLQLLYLDATCSLFAAVLFGVVTNGEAIAAAANEAHGQRITDVRLSKIISFILVPNVRDFHFVARKTSRLYQSAFGPTLFANWRSNPTPAAMRQTCACTHALARHCIM
jgi:hypothetical protein